MSTLALFFALAAIPDVALAPPMSVASSPVGLRPVVALDPLGVGVGVGLGLGVGAGVGAGPAAALDTEAASERAIDASLAEDIARRNTMGTWHRYFGIATWVAMTATVVLGTLTFHDKYGFGSALDAPCARRDTVLGQDFCTGLPVPHTIAAITTTVLYGSTATIAFLLPDPLDLAHAEGAFADKLRTHALLRWVHMGLMVATIAFGLVTNNLVADFETRRALAAVHLGLGYATWGVLTAAGALMTF